MWHPSGFRCHFARESFDLESRSEIAMGKITEIQRIRLADPEKSGYHKGSINALPAYLLLW